VEQMVDVRIDNDWFASLRVLVQADGLPPGANEFVAQAQAQLAEEGYILDNEATYTVRDPNPGEDTSYAPDA
jgi:hypothetical protein